ncbi:DUF3383 family protein [Lactiplantibacillus nangangensis]|uniref:DUF3383 family protein n=1 Tax=Lactiplantibacillus nangangensis TaxID=2559917 RepID=A0ABW1SLU7_9LACO|nr:DUF3383 family protein [Lactiplantibacillus nangangensis]
MAGKITDIYVNITTTHPVASIGLGVPGIFVAGDTLNDQHYTSLEALAADYDNSTDTYKAAEAYFNQPNSGKSIEVITYTASKTDETTKVTTGGISEAAAAYYWGQWHFGMLATYNDADALELSNYIETQNEKFFMVQRTTLEELSQFAKNTRTITLYHLDADDRFDMALLGRVGNADVGSVTWKSKGDLVGISEDKLTSLQFSDAETAHAISYVSKGNKVVTSNGWTASGAWIDQLHGIDWVKENIELQLQSLLNQEDKVPFDDNGFSQLEQVVETVLSDAYAQGIVAYDGATKAGAYAVSFDKLADVPAEDIANREYNGIHWQYTPADAVHSMTVYGTINYAA